MFDPDRGLAESGRGLVGSSTNIVEPEVLGLKNKVGLGVRVGREEARGRELH